MSTVQLGHRVRLSVGKGETALDSYGSNFGLVLGREVALVVDSGFHNGSPMQITSLLERQRNLPLVLVDTHYHSDHVFGNSVFAAVGASIVAHEKCSRSMRSNSERLLAEYRNEDPRLSRLLRGVKIAYPSITYTDNVEIHIDPILDAEVVHPPLRAHTDGDSIVYIQQEHLVFAGDIYWEGYHPNLEDADIQGQIKALRIILKMKPRRIVPGHGPVSGPREVKRFIKYLEELDRNIRSGLKKNLRDDELVRHVIPRWSWDWKMRWLMESYIKGLAPKS